MTSQGASLLLDVNQQRTHGCAITDDSGTLRAARVTPGASRYIDGGILVAAGGDVLWSLRPLNCRLKVQTGPAGGG